MNEIRDYFKANEENIKRDIKRLVDIPSVKGEPEDGAPFGKQIRLALDEAIKICREYGFSVTDRGGRVAFAHCGNEEEFIGIASHLDVVPAGDGWKTDPFCCSERGGWLVGRGTEDDKGAFVLSLWAAKYLIDSGCELKRGVRLILGVDEEAGMTDLKYYCQNEKLPLFSFTPDSDFPVCHGEKGYFEANFVSPKIDGIIKDITGGMASNVVPDACSATLSVEYFDKLAELSKSAEFISVSRRGGDAVITATGIPAHASAPDGSRNAVAEALRFILTADILSGEEEDAVRFMERIASSTDGTALSIACSDEIFTPLTIIAGMIRKSEGRFSLNVNCRFPTSTTAGEVESKALVAAKLNDFELADAASSAPYYREPNSGGVKALMKAYRDATGDEKRGPFVMAGATYARVMPNCVAFGPNFSHRPRPDWAGTAHMVDEALGIENMLDACEIYARAIMELQNAELD